jgi:hypothetical protein
MVQVLRRHLNVRTVLMLGMFALAAMGFAEPPEPVSYQDYGAVVDNEVFSNLGTYIFGILVAAVVAGLGLLVARVGVKRIWTFLRSFF